MHIRRIAVILLVVAAALSSAPARADEFADAQRLYREGQRSEALARLEQHLTRQPRDARARFLKGVILSEENRRDEAIDIFTALTQDFPELPEPYNNLAVLYAGQGNYERAREALQMAIRTYPGYATAHENLGDIYAALAREQYQKAVELDKNNKTAGSKLALIRELLPAQQDRSTTPAANPQSEAPEVRSAAGSTAPAPAEPPPAPSPSAPPAPAEGRIDTTPASPALAIAPETASAAADAPSAAAEQSAAPVRVQDRMQAVLQAVDAWAQAWSRRDADAYLSAYAPDFHTPKGEPRARWEAAKRDELSRLKEVSVKVVSPQVTFRDQRHATVTFRQDYASATAQVTGRKTLELVREGERWLIRQETFVRR
jgi:Flp pilus assembly protein TadD/ketosteroid isomerase-like protein